MQYLGIEYQMKHPPKLDPQFIPFGGSQGGHLPRPFGKMLETRAARPVRNVPYLPVSISFLSSW